MKIPRVEVTRGEVRESGMFRRTFPDDTIVEKELRAVSMAARCRVTTSPDERSGDSANRREGAANPRGKADLRGVDGRRIALAVSGQRAGSRSCNTAYVPVHKVSTLKSKRR